MYVHISNDDLIISLHIWKKMMIAFHLKWTCHNYCTLLLCPNKVVLHDDNNNNIDQIGLSISSDDDDDDHDDAIYQNRLYVCVCVCI